MIALSPPWTWDRSSRPCSPAAVIGLESTRRRRGLPGHRRRSPRTPAAGWKGISDMAATPPMADPIRAAYARQQATKKGLSTQFVRLLGFAAPSPDFDIAAYDEQAALA